MATVELRFSAQPEHVRTARLVAAAVARRAGVDEAVLDEVRLAVGEACSRAVNRHRSHGITSPVKVSLTEEEKTFSIEVGDEVPGFGAVNLLSPVIPHTIGGPLTQNTFYFNPKLPAYDIINLRLGVRHGNFDVALFINNLTDERALLALDRERGLLARVGYLTNAPRTIGLTSRVDF